MVGVALLAAGRQPKPPSLARLNYDAGLPATLLESRRPRSGLPLPPVRTQLLPGCVSEHESRLLCAACLKSLAERPAPRRSWLRRQAPAALALAGIVTAWAVYFAGAEVVMTLVDRSERSEWQSR